MSGDEARSGVVKNGRKKGGREGGRGMHTQVDRKELFMREPDKPTNLGARSVICFSSRSVNFRMMRTYGRRLTRGSPG